MMKGQNRDMPILAGTVSPKHKRFVELLAEELKGNRSKAVTSHALNQIISLSYDMPKYNHIKTQVENEFSTNSHY